MRDNQVYARIGPASGGKRSFGLLRQLRLPDDLFDERDAEQDAVDCGDWNDDLGVGRATPPVPRPRHEGSSR